MEVVWSRLSKRPPGSQPVTNVKVMESILLSKEKFYLYLHESLKHHGSPWKLRIANTTGGKWELLHELRTMSLYHVSWYVDVSSADFVTKHIVRDLPSGFDHWLVNASLPYLCINRSMNTVKRSTIQMCILCGSVMVVGSPIWMVIPYGWETLFPVFRPSLGRVHHHVAMGWEWQLPNTVRVILGMDSINQSSRQVHHNTVGEQTTTISCSNGLFLMGCGVVNNRPPWHLEIYRVI